MLAFATSLLYRVCRGDPKAEIDNLYLLTGQLSLRAAGSGPTAHAACHWYKRIIALQLTEADNRNGEKKLGEGAEP